MSTLACRCCCCCWRSFLAYHWRELPQVGFLSRQTHIDFCHDNYNVCRDKHIFVATNTRLSRQKCYLWQLSPMVLSYFFKPCQLLFCCLISLFSFFFLLFFLFLLFIFYILCWFCFDLHLITYVCVSILLWPEQICFLLFCFLFCFVVVFVCFVLFVFILSSLFLFLFFFLLFGFVCWFSD